jgi:hypothetical protein
MSKLMRSSLAFGTVVFLLLGASSACPNWSARLGVDWWSLFKLPKEMEEGLRQQEELDHRAEQIQRCVTDRQEVVAELIAGRISLLQAAVRFRRLNQRLPESADAYNHFYPGNSEGERLCRYVIAYVRSTLLDESPDLAPALVERLNAELAQLLEADGAVHLPLEERTDISPR